MPTFFALRAHEHTQLRTLACRIHDQAILSHGHLYVTNQRLFFQAADGSAVALEKPHITGLTRRRFGFLPAVAVLGLNDLEITLIAPDAWGLDNALSALAEGGAVAGPPSPTEPAVAVRRRSHSARALNILFMALCAVPKALLADLGLHRFR